MIFAGEFDDIGQAPGHNRKPSSFAGDSLLPLDEP